MVTTKVHGKSNVLNTTTVAPYWFTHSLYIVHVLDKHTHARTHTHTNTQTNTYTNTHTYTHNVPYRSI